MSPRRRLVVLLAVGLLALLTVSRAGDGQPRAQVSSARKGRQCPLVTPHASGNSAANMTHKRNATWVMTRWVARRTGVLSTLYLRVKTERSTQCYGKGRSGYAAGTSGSALVTTHPVLANGRPNLKITLARDEFNPCERAGLAESAAISLNLSVRAGEEYATIVRNVDPNPGANYFSSNFLYNASYLVGANGRNERNRAARDVFYGLDPRELVGYSRDAGASWALPEVSTAAASSQRTSSHTATMSARASPTTGPRPSAAGKRWCTRKSRLLGESRISASGHGAGGARR